MCVYTAGFFFVGLFPLLPRRVRVHDLGCDVMSFQKFVGLNTG